VGGAPPRLYLVTAVGSCLVFHRLRLLLASCFP
jgi:hypothetical protein